ncbi:MAG: AraC family transcriptional regulator [Polyangiaceae bacterium]
MAFVRAIVLAYAKYGVSPRHALRTAGISASQVERVDGRVETEQIETLAATAMQELDDEALGWFQRRLPWGSYGLLCRGSVGAPTLRVALKRWCRHHHLLTDDVVIALDAKQDADATVTLVVEENVELGPMREFCLLTLLRYVHGYVCWLLDSRLSLAEVTFPFEAPRHKDVYRFLFPGPVRFGADRAALRFDARYLELSPARDERALDTMLRSALPLTVRQYRHDRLLTLRVRTLLARPSGRTNAEALAVLLRLSVRSLHRQLAREGTSLQDLKDDVHRRRAIELLGRTNLTVKQIAAKAGFTNDKSFARAFKSWTGAAPTDFRRAQRALD